MDKTGLDSLSRLRELTADLPVGTVTRKDEVLRLLAEAWRQFNGSDITNMEARKVDGAEALRWSPPFIEFEIERHGGVVQGSARAEIQTWQVDLSAVTASCVSSRMRQISKASARFDAESVAGDLVKVICARQEDPRLQWVTDCRSVVRIQIGVVVPATGPQQTVAQRRKRLRAKLSAGLARAGWDMTKLNQFQLRPDHGDSR